MRNTRIFDEGRKLNSTHQVSVGHNTCFTSVVVCQQQVLLCVLVLCVFYMFISVRSAFSCICHMSLDWLLFECEFAVLKCLGYIHFADLILDSHGV